MDLKTQIEQFFTDIKNVLRTLAPICAFIGLVGGRRHLHGVKLVSM